MIFGAKNEPKVKDNCCGSHENSIGWVCNHFIVVNDHHEAFYKILKIGFRTAPVLRTFDFNWFVMD